MADFKTILRELTLFNGDLEHRAQVVVASKMDALDDRRKITRLKLMCARRKLPFLSISSVTGEGIQELVRLLASRLGLQDGPEKT